MCHEMPGEPYDQKYESNQDDKCLIPMCKSRHVKTFLIPHRSDDVTHSRMKAKISSNDI